MPLATVRDYAHADTLLQGRCARQRGIGNNTRLVRRHSYIGSGPDTFGIELHGTAVVTIHPDDSRELDTAGWDTVTTRDRINAYLPAPWRIGSHRREPWIYHGGWPVLPFIDHMRLTTDDRIILGDEVIMSAEDIAAERERLQAASEARQVRRGQMLTEQHARGAAGAYGTVHRFIGWSGDDPMNRTALYSSDTRYHPNTWDGAAWDCPVCHPARKDDAA